MADESGSQNFSEDPDPREKGVSGDDITPSHEQRTVLVRPPWFPPDWLARINLRLMTSKNEKASESS